MANYSGPAEESKRARLLCLARIRQQSRWPGYGNVADYHCGGYECDYVSPYTKSARNVESPVMIMLQDWASDRFLTGAFCPQTAQFGRTPARPTNVRLGQLLKEFFGIEISDTYATNLFPLIKQRGMSTHIPRQDLVRAAREFGIPQIEIVAPRLGVALGQVCFDSLRQARGLRPSPSMAEAIAEPIEISGSRVWCQAHPSVRGQNSRHRDRVAVDWQAMAAWFRGKSVAATGDCLGGNGEQES